MHTHTITNQPYVPAATKLSLARIQMVALSATMGNVEHLAQWVGGALFRTDFRPVPLVEHVKAGGELLDAQGRLLATLPSLNGGAGGGGGKSGVSGVNPDPDHTILLCQQSMQRGQQVLVFCPSKYSCLQTCSSLTDFVRRGSSGNSGISGISGNSGNSGNSGSVGASASASASASSAPALAPGPTITHLPLEDASRARLLEGRRGLLRDLEKANPHAEVVLKASLAMGVAYHNAGEMGCRDVGM
jgi:hypothetical protein